MPLSCRCSGEFSLVGWCSGSSGVVAQCRGAEGLDLGVEASPVVSGVDDKREELFGEVVVAMYFETVEVQILPFEIGAHAGIDGPFSIIEFPDPQTRRSSTWKGPPVTSTSKKPRDVRRHNSIF